MICSASFTAEYKGKENIIIDDCNYFDLDFLQ